MTTRQLRTLRGALAAGVATLLAACSHTIGGAEAPSAWVVVAAAILALPVCVALIGRRITLIGMALAVGAAQALFHTAFALTASADASAVHAGHVAHGALLIDDGGARAVLPEPGMLTAHIVAAVLTVALLHRGERVVAAIAAGLRVFVATLRAIAPVPLDVTAHAPALPSAAVRIPAAPFACIVRRRGPPVG